ncbi:recombinase family protein [Candidatus Pollutiaquabacter sp.]|uniref:recombinase family protein n=1 Tax=Candidatus Pollutiaquabacter sp. TaxID=3416354 RepID=UPI003C7EEA26|nr:recombinase family protein [Bacteroidota bacterium]
MIRTIIYSRVSTDEQANRGYSLRDQEEKLRRYCVERNLEIVCHVQDDASAKSFDRPGFQKMLRQLHGKELTADMLLVLKWDRFSRNTTDAYAMIRELGEMAIAVQSIEQPIDFSVPENKVMLAVYLTIPEVENDRRSMNTRAGMRQGKKEGRWMGRAPLGYKLVRDARNKPAIIKSDKASLIEEAFRLYSFGGVSIEKIRQELLLKGLNISKNQFLNILRNPVYAGFIVLRAFKNEPATLVPGLHEPIISKELFDRCQQIRKRATKKKDVTKCFNPLMPLRGYLICRKCGRMLTGSSSKGNGGLYVYYHCSNGCKERFRDFKAHAAFHSYLSSFQPSPVMVEIYTKVLEQHFAERRKSAVEDARLCEQGLVAVKTKLERLNDLFISNEIDKESYTSTKERLIVELTQLQERLASVTSRRKDSVDFVRASLGYLTSLADRYEGARIEFKQRLLGSMFPKKLIFENDKVRTIGEPSFLESIFMKINQLQPEKTKGGTKNSVPPSLAPPPGLEPGTL